MAEKDVQSYLEKGLYGTPQLKPEEQKKYLGTFRERVYFVMTMDEMATMENQAILKQVINDHPKELLLLNGTLADALQTSYLEIIKQFSCTFTFVTDPNVDTGLVYCAKEAVNVAAITLQEKKAAQPPLPEETSTPQKTSFWQRLIQKKNNKETR